MRLLPYGDTGLLVDEAGDRSGLLALRAAVLAEPGVIDAIPAAQTLLVEFDPSRTTPARLAQVLEAAEVSGQPAPSPAAVQIRVRYDGPDLDDVAHAAGMSRDAVIQSHCASTYTVAFCGFSPGFAYLDGLDPALHVARLDRPRTVVPAGAVGIAGEFTGVYPRPSPGGWRLLGSTDATLWDPAGRPPALLQPGAKVRFVPA